MLESLPVYTRLGPESSEQDTAAGVAGGEV
jgi:hypothetical protein